MARYAFIHKHKTNILQELIDFCVRMLFASEIIAFRHALFGECFTLKNFTTDCYSDVLPYPLPKITRLNAIIFYVERV